MFPLIICGGIPQKIQNEIKEQNISKDPNESNFRPYIPPVEKN